MCTITILGFYHTFGFNFALYDSFDCGSDGGILRHKLQMLEQYLPMYMYGAYIVISYSISCIA